jgi:hypothetical protein
MSALEDAGVVMGWLPYSPDSGTSMFYAPGLSAAAAPAAAGGSREGPPVVVAHMVPEYFPQVRHERPEAFLVGQTVWETDRLPRHWIACMDAVDLLIVPVPVQRRCDRGLPSKHAGRGRSLCRPAPAAGAPGNAVGVDPRGHAGLLHDRDVDAAQGSRQNGRSVLARVHLERSRDADRQDLSSRLHANHSAGRGASHVAGRPPGRSHACSPRIRIPPRCASSRRS